MFYAMKGDREKVARYGLAVSALVFETYRALATRHNDVVSVGAAANGKRSPFSESRCRVQFDRALVNADATVTCELG